MQSAVLLNWRPTGDNSAMTDSPDYRGYRFPREVIARAVWLCHRFKLSFRDVEDLMFESGITVSYETVHQWCLTFGPVYARKIRKRQGRRGNRWFLDTGKASFSLASGRPRRRLYRDPCAESQRY